jgi:hypothetical protein
MLSIAPMLLVTLSLVAAQRKTDPSPCPPPDPAKATGPVTARLVARKTTYILDRMGMTAADYRQAIRNGRVSPPAVDLVLELVNTSAEELRVRVTGAAPKLTLTLKGKGNILTRSAKRANRAPLTYQVLKPGEKYSIPLATLAGYSSSTMENQLFWTEPGEYTLEANFRTYIYANALAPAAGAGLPKMVNKLPAGAKSAIFELKTEPVRLSVKLK